jgi:uncharacterized protein YgiM (DUF1202 family)
MLRLTLILCIGMYAALMIAGVDRGQLRPGLADAAAKAANSEVTAVAEADSAPVAAGPQPMVDPVIEAPATEVTVAPVAEVQEDVVAVAEPEPYVEPAREVVTAVEEPIFSLSAVGNEAVPSTPAEEAAPAPEALANGEGTIWYVNASSVNVRAEPSTTAEVVGKLGAGEATLVVQAVDDEWARIVIQGDGVEGFVALRYLSAEAP